MACARSCSGHNAGQWPPAYLSRSFLYHPFVYSIVCVVQSLTMWHLYELTALVLDLLKSLWPGLTPLGFGSELVNIVLLLVSTHWFAVWATLSRQVSQERRCQLGWPAFSWAIANAVSTEASWIFLAFFFACSPSAEGRGQVGTALNQSYLPRTAAIFQAKMIALFRMWF